MISNMKLATSKQIKQIDRLSTSKYGIPSQTRMEIAGIKSYEIIQNEYSLKKTLVIVGTGNNGGDGLVLARYLKLNNHNCSVVIVRTSKTPSEDFKNNLLIIRKLKIEIIKEWKKTKFKDYSLIVDAIFGVGLNRPLNSKVLDLVKKLNKLPIPICSLDLPTGLNPDNGQIFPDSILADTTITYDFAKPGLVTDPGAKYSKKIFIVKLPTPNDLTKELNNHYINSSFFENFFKKRSKSSNKGTFGHVLVIGGSKNMSGAVLLSGLAAYKSGSGLVSLCVPKNISNNLKNKIPESIIIEVPNSDDSTTMDENKFLLSLKTNIRKKPACVVIGPGLGDRKGLIKIIEDSFKFFNCPIILDADGLNLISTNLNLLKKCKNDLIITPHPGEMSKISGKSINSIQNNRIDTAVKVSKKLKCISILKGFRTVISNINGETFINGSGNEGMATGGMGDALTGIIASFIGQGYSTLDSSIFGVFLHGKAGDNIAQGSSKRGILASQIIQQLPNTILSIEKNSDFTSKLEKIENE